MFVKKTCDLITSLDKFGDKKRNISRQIEVQVALVILWICLFVVAKSILKCNIRKFLAL